MSVELHHFHKKQLRSILDRMIYIVAIFGPLAALPQLIIIWTNKNAADVSLITWGGYASGAIFWITYGILHKAKPVIIANIILGTIAFGIVLGIFLYG